MVVQGVEDDRSEGGGGQRGIFARRCGPAGAGHHEGTGNTVKLSKNVAADAMLVELGIHPKQLSEDAPVKADDPLRRQLRDALDKLHQRQMRSTGLVPPFLGLVYYRLHNAYEYKYKYALTDTNTNVNSCTQHLLRWLFNAWDYCNLLFDYLNVMSSCLQGMKHPNAPRPYGALGGFGMSDYLGKPPFRNCFPLPRPAWPHGPAGRFFGVITD